MRPMARLAAFVIGVFAIVHGALATELLTNGNFEVNSAGLPTGWTYITNGDGPATLQNAANSPFTNIYPGGANDTLFTDGTSAAVSPILLQNFASQSSGTIYASWDFNLASLTNGNYWTIQIDDSASVSLRFDMDITGGFFAYEANAVFNNVLALTANTWYQVTVALDITNHTFNGSITPFGGSSTAFSSNTWRINTGTLNRIIIDDVNGSPQNANIQFDNLSVNTVAPVPEPSTLALLALGIGGAFFAKRLRRRAI
jgi:hypothetical protein